MATFKLKNKNGIETIYTKDNIKIPNADGTGYVTFGSGGGKEEQEKSVTYTENGEYEVTPEEGKTLSSVSISVDVPTPTPNLQPKTVTENGTVTPDTGYDGLSQVIVNVPSSAIPVDVSTDAEMTALLTADNVGKVYRFTGTTGTYINSDLYVVEKEEEPPTPSVFTVSITGGYDNSCSVFDGSDESGISLGYLGAETKTYQITSGYIYLDANQHSVTTPKTTGGVSTITLGDYDMLFKVTGDGTITNVAFLACFVEGTLITLADGSRKAVEDITYDDDLLVWNFYEGKFDTAKPTWIMPVKQAPEYNKLTFANGSELKLVGSGGNIGYHRIYNDDAKCFTHTGVPDTQIGCNTFTDDGVFTKLISQEVVKEPVNYYNIITEKHYNLFTNGILTSCRLSNQYYIENMKYVGESKMSEQEIAEYLERLER